MEIDNSDIHYAVVSYFKICVEVGIIMLLGGAAYSWENCFSRSMAEAD
jgi:hypothetical protein